MLIRCMLITAICLPSDSITGMELIEVKGGCYQMGDNNLNSHKLMGGLTSDQVKRLDGETVSHEVCVSSFFIGRYDVTVDQFRRFVGSTGYRTDAEKSDGCYVPYGRGGDNKQAGTNWQNPGFSQDDRHPVVCVSWNDAKAFADWLSTQGSNSYRLPTEAEWEYAARSGGQKEKYSGFNDDTQLHRFANFCDVNCDGNWKDASQDDGYRYTSPVGSYQPNGLGLYDMSGNVYQWVSDWYGLDYYSHSPNDNPLGPLSGSYRVQRGGSWNAIAKFLRSAERGNALPSDRISTRGFRLVSP